MNKTIFRLDYKISMLIVSVLGIVMGFITNAYGVNGIISFIFHLFKIFILTFLYLVLYFVENKNLDFKNKLKYMLGGILLLNASNLIFSIFTTTHILSGLFLTFSGVVSLYMVISFTLEIINLYYQNKFIDKMILFNKKIGTAVAEPIISLFKRTTND